MTVSPGMASPSSWLLVAVSLAEYLQGLVDKKDMTGLVPKAAMMSVQRFFEYVLHGIAFDRRQPCRSDIPVMAGISNFTIATGVFFKIGLSTSQDEVAARISKYSEVLKRLTEKGVPPEDKDTVKEMILFFEELWEQGDRDHVEKFYTDDDGDD